MRCENLTDAEEITRDTQYSVLKIAVSYANSLYSRYLRISSIENHSEQKVER